MLEIGEANPRQCTHFVFKWKRSVREGGRNDRKELMDPLEEMPLNKTLPSSVNFQSLIW